MGKKVPTILSAALAVVIVALAAVGVLYAQEKQTVGKYVQQQAELSALIESLNADVAEKELEIDTLNADVADKASQIDALNADVADKASQIDSLNADVADKASQIDSLNADVADKNSQLEQMTSELADKDVQIDALNADVSAKKSEIDALNADSTGKDNTIESLNAELEQLRQSGNVVDEIPSHIPGAHATTRQFLYVLEQYDITYTYLGVDSDGDDCLAIIYNCANDRSITLWMWFSADGDNVALQVWDVCSFAESERTSMQSLCDMLNSLYRHICFYTEDDNTVSMRMDCLLGNGEDAGHIVMDAVSIAMIALEMAFDQGLLSI